MNYYVDLDKALSIIDKACLKTDDDKLPYYKIKSYLLSCVVSKEEIEKSYYIDSIDSVTLKDSNGETYSTISGQEIMENMKLFEDARNKIKEDLENADK